MLFLGVDGGGTKTAALVADESGRVQGWGISQGSNYHLFGLEQAGSNIRRAVETALAGRTANAACFCLASADMPHDFAQLRSKIDEFGLGCPFGVRNDVIGIFRAGSRFPFGVGIVCGTGFNAGGVGKDGREYRVPALGAITGDIAGARHLTVKAVGAAFRAWDGRGSATRLSEAILEALGAPDYDAVAESWVRGELNYERVSALAPVVFAVSEAGDEVAQQLVREQGVELGTAANAVLRRLELTDVDCDVVLGGGLCYGQGDLLMDTVRETVHSQSPYAVVKRLDVPPVVGAVLFAYESSGSVAERPFVEALHSTLPESLRR